MAHEAELDLLADLTPAQQEAVTHIEGPLLVLAGAGSGKTRVITRRVAFLIQQGVKPYNILAITFTNKAAGEMRQRIEALVPNCRVWVSTFHSLGARLLRQYADRLGLERNFTIYDQSDRGRLVKAALEDANIDNVRFTPERIESAISKAKNQLLGPERYAEQAADFFSQTVARVYPIYEKKLRAPMPSILTTCSFGPLWRSETMPSCVKSLMPASVSCLSTNTRTPTRHNTPSLTVCRSIIRTCAQWAIRISPFTDGVAPIFATFSTLNVISPMPACSRWNATSAARS